MADPSTEGAFTDAEATVGDFTFEGTANLMLAGTVAGVLGGLLYLGIRRWLPVPSQWNGVAFSVFTLVTVGNALFDPANADFQIFEPAILVLGLFSLLFFLNGILLARLMDRVHPEPAYVLRKRVTAVGTGVVAVVTLVGALVFIGGSIGMIEDQGTCKSAVGAGGGCAVFSDP
ncbi:MAG TPA: hypothetical protein VFK32_04730 [Tepidiformaceae bacterium]|nr:hypothetical protein [Tepidiformaceae bacterium]